MKKEFLLYKDRMYVPNVPKVKLLILDEIHKTPYSGHLGYQNWQNISLDVLNVNK